MKLLLFIAMLKKLNLLLTVAIFASIISGCRTTTQGAVYASETSRVENLLKKNSDKKDVFYAVGQPVYVRQDGDKSIWIVMRAAERLSAGSYIPFASILTGGANYKVNKIEFEFDNTNSLKSVKKEDFEVTTNFTDFYGWYNDNVKNKINDETINIDINHITPKYFSLKSLGHNFWQIKLVTINNTVPSKILIKWKY